MAETQRFKRVVLVVLDGVGAGELPDAPQYGDSGADTLGNLARAFAQQTGRKLNLPNLQRWGIGNLSPMEGVPPCAPGQGFGAYGRAIEQSRGKDTTSGHWEMAGLVVHKAFATYPNGFSEEVIAQWCQENELPGVLGNCSASGTEIIEKFGLEHMKTGKPILYTSADSVWQVAAHEEAFGLEKLFQACKSARKICDKLQIGRVIARPFVGNPEKGVPFKRTYHRKDYAQPPFSRTALDVLVRAGVRTLGVGKISNIYAGKGVLENIDTAGNTDGIRVLIEQLKQVQEGLIFCNLIDFDMLYGHRRDVKGFGLAMEEFDAAIPAIQATLGQGDLLILSADHGNDPTYPGTDHTREYAPILAWAPGWNDDGPLNLGTRKSFGDIGATFLHALLGNDHPEPTLVGTSFLPELTG